MLNVPVKRRGLAQCLLSLTAAMVLASCGSVPPPDLAAPSSGPVSPPVQTTQPGNGPSLNVSPLPSPSGTTIDVTYAGGKVSGVEGRVHVAVGEQVVVRVTSDVADEIHVHGYDLMADVPAGGTAEIPLMATIPGTFEVELESSGKLLFQLRVS